MAKQIQIKLGTSTTRTSVVDTNSKTPKAVLTDNNVTIEGAQVYMDGALLSVTEMNTPIEELAPNADEIMLVTVIKADNGMQ